MKNDAATGFDPIARYSESQKRGFREVCELLRATIGSKLPQAASRIYYSFPVWFIDDIPIVGYKATARQVTLLFWSGGSFKEKNLIAAGKYQAAQIAYTKSEDIDVPELERWLGKARKIIWDYRSLPSNGGRLVRHTKAAKRVGGGSGAHDKPGSRRGGSRAEGTSAT